MSSQKMILIKNILTRISFFVLAVVLFACSKTPSNPTTTVTATSVSGAYDPMLPDFKNASGANLWLRPTVEMLPENKRGPLLNYLDGARGIADLGVQKFKNNEIEGLYQMLSPMLKNQGNIDQFHATIDAMKNATGDITNLEYRNQAVEYGAATLEGKFDLNRAAFHTYYMATTTKFKANQLFLDISVYRQDDQSGIIAIQYNTYGFAPSWLQSPDAKISPP